MKAILMSIKPQWVAKILNGEKTLEIRKTMPKCDLPIDVYIYCTKENDLFKSYIRMGYYTTRSTADDLEYNGKGKVVARFWCDRVEEIKPSNLDNFAKDSCLTIQELENYLWSNICCGYAWHIDNLEIFDEPKVLSEFAILVKSYKYHRVYDYLTCPPQSWCFVEI